jgi:hypothetical protein
MKELSRGIWLIEKIIEAEKVPSGDIMIFEHMLITHAGTEYPAYSVSINTKDTDNICDCFNLEVAKLVAEKILMSRIDFIELFKQLKKTESNGH